MALTRAWVGRRDKPPIDPFINRSRVHSKWGWVWDHQVAVWLFNEPGGDTLHDLLCRANGTLSAGSSGSKPTWGRDGYLWGLTPIDAGTEAGINLPAGGASPLGDNFTPPQLTVETWSKWPADDNTDPRLFSKQDGGGEANHYIMVGGINSSGTGTRPRARFRIGGNTDTVVLTSGESPAAGNLAHTVWIYDGSGVRVWLNGILGVTYDDAWSGGGDLDGGTAIPMRIGNSANTSTANEWDATIYKIVIYDMAMPPSLIVDISGDPYGPYREVEEVVGFVVPVAGGFFGRRYYDDLLAGVT